MTSSRKSAPFFTIEDFKASFALFCTVCGIGTLGMPANFARAGPYIATAALLLMASANIYASVTLSRVMLLAPRSVRSYSDLGEWAMGKTGRFLVVISHMGVCLLVPCAFLVLGSMLFMVLFPGAFSQTFWIIFMALVVFPVALIPTIKEGSGMMLAGCLGTIIADIVGIAVLMHEMGGHPTAPSPDFSLKQIVTTFGNLSLAYGAAIVIPDLQREHSEPKRMPRVVFVTLTIVSFFFLALAATGYVAAGCQVSGNLLFSIVDSDASGKTSLGFIADRGAVVMAYLFMQLHIVIAFSTLLHPAFFIFERFILGMHKTQEGVFDEQSGNEDLADGLEKQSYISQVTPSLVSGESTLEGDLEHNGQRQLDGSSGAHDGDDATLAQYRGTRNTLRYVLMRTVLIVLLVVASIALKDKFLDLVDFIGASTITMCCLILPLTFYLKICWNKVPMYEKFIAIFLILLCTGCGLYVMYNTGKVLFGSVEPVTPETPVFPFCPVEHQFKPFFVKST